MEKPNILHFSSIEEWRNWLSINKDKEKECYIPLNKGKPKADGKLYYLDAVEVAICYGWIDSTHLEIDGIRMQRFSPRKKASPWTELNKERARRLIKLGLMDSSGKKTLPPLGKNSFKIDKDIEIALKRNRAYSSFRSFPPLYQRVRAYNVAFYKSRDKDLYEASLAKLISTSKSKKMYGEWNDYGRLLDY